MDWLIKLFAGSFLSSVGGILKPVFDWLNTKVDANARMHISDNDTMTKLTGSAVGGVTAADNANAATRQKEGPWSPWVIATIAGFMLPFGFHTWEVVFDACPWIISLSDWYLPTIQRHVPYSWGVKPLIGQFEQTEQAVINSLFVGASAFGVAYGVVKAIKK